MPEAIAGWKDINESDMLLSPRAETVVADPFADKPTLILICDVREPSTGIIGRIGTATGAASRELGGAGVGPRPVRRSMSSGNASTTGPGRPETATWNAWLMYSGIDLADPLGELPYIRR